MCLISMCSNMAINNEVYKIGFYNNSICLKKITAPSVLIFNDQKMEKKVHRLNFSCFQLYFERRGPFGMRGFVTFFGMRYDARLNQQL